MELNQLTAISPIDGRYRDKVQFLDNYFSEYALIKYRVQVEIEYFLFLADKKLFSLPLKSRKVLRQVIQNFSEADALAIKQIEAITNHDVKAVEYWLKAQLEKTGAGEVKEWIHFALTSQDINNTSIPLCWKACMENEYLPWIVNIQKSLHSYAAEWRHIPMLARTHGQAASPTTLGKELMVFVERLANQIRLFGYIPYSAKFGGATGNFNAHHVAFPTKDWPKLGDQFVEGKLGCNASSLPRKLNITTTWLHTLTV